MTRESQFACVLAEIGFLSNDDEYTKMINSKYEIGDVVNIEVQSKEFGRIATQNAKNVILQKIREEERKVYTISITAWKKML
mgnify:CR=1 FL=1